MYSITYENKYNRRLYEYDYEKCNRLKIVSE